LAAGSVLTIAIEMIAANLLIEFTEIGIPGSACRALERIPSTASNAPVWVCSITHTRLLKPDNY
jgi:hypothetical protein